MIFSSLVELKNFNVFSEYFIGISALYILIVVVLISYNVYGLLIRSGKRHCKVFHIRRIIWYYIFNPFFGSLL